MEHTKSQPMAWGVIIFFLVVFWPLGLFFLFRRLSSDRCAVLKNARMVSTVSYVLLGISVIYIILAFTSGFGYLTPAVLTGGGGFLLNGISRRMKVTGERYKKYIVLVVNHSQTSIDAIASAMGVPRNVAMADLQEMIKRGYFKGAYIDKANREIHIARPSTQPQQETQAIMPEKRIVNCQSCGADNIVVGRFGECEYCGSLLQ